MPQNTTRRLSKMLESIVMEEPVGYLARFAQRTSQIVSVVLKDVVDHDH
jgi:hypothetical protein